MNNTIYQDNLVTIDSEVVRIGATQYDLDGIVSFTGLHRPKQACLARAICIGLFVLGLLCVFGAAMNYYLHLQLHDFNFGTSMDEKTSENIYYNLIISSVFLVPAILILLWIRSQKDTYLIQFQTSAGSVEAVSSHNEKYIDQLLTALGEAKRQSKALRR